MPEQRKSAKNVLCVECSPAQWVTEHHKHKGRPKKPDSKASQAKPEMCPRCAFPISEHTIKDRRKCGLGVRIRVLSGGGIETNRKRH
jgi:ribosomal protein S27AE